MRQLNKILLLTVILALPALGRADRLPNIVVMFCDDMGYADVGCFGAEGYQTPNLDRMARQGVKLTNFHVASAVCSASRSALMTGCYNTRVGIRGALGPKSNTGINANEMTMAELLKQKGYATACFGKWHLGHLEPFLPTNNGFDEYFGLPYSNDMWPYHPNVLHLPMEQRLKKWPNLPLFEGTRIVNPQVTPDDQRNLTTWYTEKSVDFINRNADRPFFLYIPHSMPHVPLYVSDKFAGKTERGLYGDVISEIDWSMGQVLGALKRNGIDDNTLVIFTSDNGPWLSYGEHSGVALPLREGKGTSWEGGIRVPFIARWPGRIPSGRTVAEPAMTIDVFTTVAKLAGAKPPRHKIDGVDIWPLLTRSGAISPKDAYYVYYGNDQLQSVISGRWKLVLPHRYRTLNGRPGGKEGLPVNYENLDVKQPELYDMFTDISEANNVAALYPDVVKQLQVHAERAYADLGDGPLKKKGSGVRLAGKVAMK